MIKINRIPCVEHLIRHLHHFGISQIMMNLHYKPMSFMKYFGTRVHYTYEPKLLGEEGTIESLRNWMDDYLVVMNGDTLTNVNILEMLRIGKGQNIKFMEGNVYAGTRIIKPNNLYGKEYKYEDKNAYWFDIGTFEGLRKARQFYAKESNYLPDLSN